MFCIRCQIKMGLLLCLRESQLRKRKLFGWELRSTGTQALQLLDVTGTERQLLLVFPDVLSWWD